jgi:SEC-C motif domain protein
LKQAACPCGSSAPLAACCGRFVNGDALPDTAEQLMRSRYAAYVLRDTDYLLRTWHPRTRPATLALDDAHWLGLEIKRHVAHGDHAAQVEFVARFRVAGKGHRLHETSRFERVDGRWLYVDGTFDDKKNA